MLVYVCNLSICNCAAEEHLWLANVCVYIEKHVICVCNSLSFRMICLHIMFLSSAVGSRIVCIYIYIYIHVCAHSLYVQVPSY